MHTRTPQSHFRINNYIGAVHPQTPHSISFFLLRCKKKEIEEKKKNRRLNSVSSTQHPAGELASLRQHRLTVVSLTDTKLLFIYPCEFR